MISNVVLELVSFLVGQTPAMEIDRANMAAMRVRELIHDLNSSTSVAKLAREEAKAKTGVDTDPNPYFSLDELPRMLACLVAARAQGTRPELVLALWMKEASANVFTDIVLDGPRAVTTADHAKALFIAMNFFKFLGADLFTRFKPTAGENILLEAGQFAPEHRAVLDRANSELMALGVAREDYAKAMRDALVVSGGTGGQPFRVQAGGPFYPAMLSIAHALFEKIRTQRDTLFDEFSLTYPLSEQLAYLIFNNGRGAGNLTQKGAYALLKATVERSGSERISLQESLLGTQVVRRPWAGPRTNLVRFDYYLKCYAPIFA